MNTSIFTATPVMQCYSPSRTFNSADDAFRYAETAARQHGVGYAVWQRGNGQLKRLRTFPATPGHVEGTQP